MKKRILSVFLVIIMTFTLFPWSAFPVAADSYIYYGECGADGDNLMWALDEEEGLLVIVGEGEMADYDFSDYYKIAPWYELESIIKEVYIDDGVTSIGNCAFYGCGSITGVYIADSVRKIGARAFVSCTSLEEIYIPDGIERIEDTTFYWCTSLKGINIPDSVAYIGKDAFYDCRKIENVFVSDLSLWSAVAFEGGFSNPLAYGGTLYVDGKPFSTNYSGKCGMDIAWFLDAASNTLTISGNGNMYTFSGSTVAPWNEYARYIPIETVVINDGVTNIGNRAFSYCTALKQIELPKSITSIGDEAFYECDSLKAINIPDSVTSIGKGAFTYCRRLESVIIPIGITTIEARTFYWCNSLNSIVIPKSVVLIGENAFDVCSKLKQVYYEGSQKDWDKIDIRGGNNYLKWAKLTYYYSYSPDTYYGECGAEGDNLLWSLNTTTGVLTIKGKGDMADFYNSPRVLWKEHSYYIKKIVIDDGVTSIGKCAFYGCNYIETVEIADSVTSIGESAFESCSKLRSINIPDGITSIKDSTFRNCTSLTSIDIPDGVTIIGDRAFYYCYSLKSIEIPEGVTSIGADAFENCNSLVSIVIPKTLTDINDFAFDRCDALENVYFTGSEAQWKSIKIGIYNEALLKANVIFDYVRVILGDVSGDREVDMKDILLIRQSMVGLAEVDLRSADVNRDGEVNIKDVLMIRKYIVGIISEFTGE